MVGAASWRRRLSEDVRSGRRVGREGVGDDSELCSCQLMVLHPGSCRSLLSGPRRVYCSLVDSIAVMESDVGGCLQRRITCLLQRAPSPNHSRPGIFCVCAVDACQARARCSLQSGARATAAPLHKALFTAKVLRHTQTTAMRRLHTAHCCTTMRNACIAATPLPDPARSEAVRNCRS
jgi:hypothetical protein